MFDKFSKAYNGVLIDNEYVNYYEEFDLQIILNRIDGIKVVLIENETIRVERNKKTILVINVGNSDTTTSNGITISVENVEITDGNQYEVDSDTGTIIDTSISTETEWHK